MKLVSSLCRLLCVSLKADRSHETGCITLNSPFGIRSESPPYVPLSIQQLKRRSFHPVTKFPHHLAARPLCTDRFHGTASACSGVHSLGDKWDRYNPRLIL